MCGVGTLKRGEGTLVQGEGGVANPPCRGRPLTPVSGTGGLCFMQSGVCKPNLYLKFANLVWKNYFIVFFDQNCDYKCAISIANLRILLWVCTPVCRDLVESYSTYLLLCRALQVCFKGHFEDSASLVLGRSRSQRI